MSIVEKKLEILRCLEKAFDEFVETNYKVACKKACAVCCTQDICTTTLEARRMLTALKDSGQFDMIERVRETVGEDLFRPRITTNTLAFACLNQEEPPIEEPASEPEVCPFLKDDACVAYESRPFTCRGMFSINDCRAAGEAELPEELITIVTVGWQIIEHLDVGGLYGNFYDLMAALDDPNLSFKYDMGEKLQIKGTPPNRPVPGFLVPPEQQGAVNRFLTYLYNSECGGKTFRERMMEVRDAPF